MMGDGECSEGSVWEAMAFASYYKLDNLVAILDVNRLGQSEAAPLQHNMNTYKERCEAFGYVLPLIFTPLLFLKYNASYLQVVNFCVLGIHQVLVTCCILFHILLET